MERHGSSLSFNIPYDLLHRGGREGGTKGVWMMDEQIVGERSG
jgi:hypothetical protein